ncbi:SDR family oxidoreductase [Agriterribacter sp.]|uniref:SDR family oxidoreductase n=1 Tax=Agriterribacter sp. TaxID=2821509 RepID=UPI002B5469EE|nr:SDR family oxidoreductase [Agriterribacter sp.]HRO47016.1 SDR family oxidoreductase [Agriterribacter sp.]HRQ17832.1 SDR family oxidoreductase [Agriterribacter sp.]
MKILVTGANGLLGQNAVQQLTTAGHEVTATGRGACRLPAADKPYRYAAIDITDKESVLTQVAAIRPDVIIHAAAMAQPDACELNKEACYNTNVNATRYFTDAAAAVNAKLVYISTDFVFSGDDGPYRETDLPAPVNYYGETKWEAEQIVQQSGISRAIVRTVLVYGNILAGTRSNIVTWVKENLEKGNPIKVVSDQVRTPTYIGDLVSGIQLIIEKNAGGIYHISGREVLTPYDMAVQVAGYFGLNKALMEKVDAAVFTQPARRPLKTGFIIHKAEKELGYSPISFMEGIRNMFP